MDKAKADGLKSIKSIKEKDKSILDELDMTFVATGTLY